MFFVPPETPEVVKRRTLLKEGERREWWIYESENPAGYVGPDGTTYGQVTYSIRLRDDLPERVLLGEEVTGYVLCMADQALVADQLAFRPGMAT